MLTICIGAYMLSITAICLVCNWRRNNGYPWDSPVAVENVFTALVILFWLPICIIFMGFIIRRVRSGLAERAALIAEFGPDWRAKVNEWERERLEGLRQQLASA